MTQNLVAWDTSTDRMVRTDKTPDDISAGGSLGNNRVGSEAITNGALTHTVTFSTVLPDTNYTANANFFNSADNTPIFQPIMITNKTTSGFTAKWNAPVDSGNYELAYTASPTGFSQLANSLALTNGDTSKTLSGINPPFGSTDFAVTLTFNNETDSEPIFQPIVITNKTVTGFTAKWNAPVDSNNYSLEYHIALFA